MRTELIHPLLVHFPIALLSTGVLLRIFDFFFRKKAKASFLLPASWVILSLGVIFAWLAVIAGTFAADIVAPTLKNQKLLSQHALHAYRTAFSFSLALFIDLVRGYYMAKKRSKKWPLQKGLAVVLFALYLFGLGNLIITGGYGAALVYEQGAGVLKQN